MFKTLSATLLCLFWVISCSFSVFFATGAVAQQANFVKYKKPKLLPDITLQTMGGQKTSLHKLIKKKAKNGDVLLHLWSPRCGICVKELPAMERAAPSLAKKGMPIISLAVDQRGLRRVKTFLRRKRLGKGGVYYDPDMAVSHFLQARGVPMTYIVSSKGEVLAAHAGAMSW